MAITNEEFILLFGDEFITTDKDTRNAYLFTVFSLISIIGYINLYQYLFDYTF